MWPHAPPHWAFQPGTYFVTAGTFRRVRHFRDGSRLQYLTQLLLSTAEEFGWKLEAWAIFSNHYHFVAKSDGHSVVLSRWLKSLHGRSSVWLNREDGVSGRKVWHNFRETPLTFERSYYARLSYVHRNAVHHGLVARPEDYLWCSASWFAQNASAAAVKTVYSFKTDRINVDDDFEV